jgi:hypothetical protein
MSLDGYFERLPGGSMFVAEHAVRGSGEITIDWDGGSVARATGDPPITIRVSAGQLPRALLRVRRLLQAPHRFGDMAWIARRLA